MLVLFELTMPGHPTWNGSWSGEGRYYASVKNISKKNALEILDKKTFYYSWSDGWAARINVSHIDSKQKAKVLKKSNGFLGYDWMINDIICYHEIRNR